jgi:membrane fusion protein (multidrug efflux system)
MGIMQIRRTRNAAVALLAAFVLLPAGCRKRDTQAAVAREAPAIPVTVIRVQSEPFSLTVPVTGTLVSNTRVDVKAETIGRLVKFPKQEGDSVAAGEAVAWVDQENYQLAVRQAETAVQVAEAALARTRVMAAHNQTELDRARSLIKSGGITEQDLQMAQVTERDGQAQVSLAEAQLAQARAALGVAQKRLRDTAILAPVAGVIERKFVNAGAYVEAPTQLLTIVDNQRLELESPVPSSQLDQLRSGQTVTFRVNSYPGAVFEGRVIEINPAVDTQTRAALVRIRVNNAAGKLKTGMFAEGEILTGVEPRAIVVPAGAVYRSGGTAQESYVFVVVDGKAVRRGVRLGREQDSKLEIQDGLKAGDLLVAEQRIELAEGVRVEPGK